MTPAPRRSTRLRQPSTTAESTSSSDSRSGTPSRRRKREHPRRSTPRKRREAVLAIGRPRQANGTAQKPITPTHSQLPPWPAPAKIPYDVLLSIFQCATYPLIDASNKVTHASWLVKVARLRRDFAEPALAALYYDPPLESAERAHDFLRALQAQADDAMVDYRRKIRYLDMNAMPILTFKFAGQDPLLLSSFISLTPMLRGLRINWPSDDPSVPAWNVRVPHAKSHLWYGTEIFDILESQNITLEEWKWNFVFGPKQAYPWQQLKQIHQRPVFQRIRKLECCQLNSISAPIWEEFSCALGQLPLLEDLVVCAPAVPRDNLRRLFHHVRLLRSLTFSHCDSSLDSETVTAVLTAHGAALRSLTFRHNPQLDLAFLSTLQAQCPHLESLVMDFTFFSRLNAGRDNTPMYATLLPSWCTPSWPRTLRHLSLVHLRKWDTRAATRFFDSLLEAAPELEDLRYLELRMSVDADWKDRISFRNKWEALLPRVYRRTWVEPRCWTAQTVVKNDTSSGRPSAKRSQRIKAAEEAEEAHDSSGVVEDYEGVVQGCCDIVDVRVENLRPMERQLDESNFLDEEPSGDEDYED